MTFKTKIINIEIEWLLIIVILVTLLSPKIANLLDVFYMCYFFIFFHELSHIFIASILGKRAEKITFSLAGVCVVFEKNYSSKKTLTGHLKNIAIYIAGPLANIILAIIFKSNEIIFGINLFLAILNCMPISPLDGHNITKEILEIIINQKKVETILKILSNILLILIIVLAIYQIIYYKMASLLIFSIYLYLLKNTNKDEINYDRILQELTG